MDNSALNCANLVRTTLNDWDEHRQKHVLLLQGLTDLVLEHPERAEAGFTTNEVHTAVSNLMRKPWGDPDAVPKTVSRAWKQLLALWSKKETGLQQLAKDANLSGYPAIDKTPGGGGGLYSRYFLKSKPFEDADKQTDRPYTQGDLWDESTARYHLDDLESLGVIARSLGNGFQLAGWRKAIFLAILTTMLLTVFFVLLIVWAGISRFETVGQLASILVGVSLILWSIWRSFGPFVRILDLGVSVAPSWLQGWSGKDDRLLVFQRGQPDAPNQIKLARYTGKCPICGGQLLIRDGARAFPGRLVGRCSNSPREHVFSFDHYLRRGLPLYGAGSPERNAA